MRQRPILHKQDMIVITNDYHYLCNYNEGEGVQYYRQWT